jgi:hypothetical protein
LPVTTDRRGEIRGRIVDVHGQMRAGQSLTDDNVVEVLGWYQATDCIHEKLRVGMLSYDELRLVEYNTNRFISLTNNPGHRLAPDVMRKMDDIAPFARFHAGVFALARDDYETAAAHFSRANDNWGIKVEKLNKLFRDQRFEKAAALLGPSFSRIRRLFKSADPGGKPTGIFILGKDDLKSILPPEDMAKLKPPASQGPLAPQTKQDSRSPRGGK